MNDAEELLDALVQEHRRVCAAKDARIAELEERERLRAEMAPVNELAHANAVGEGEALRERVDAVLTWVDKETTRFRLNPQVCSTYKGVGERLRSALSVDQTQATETALDDVELSFAAETMGSWEDKELALGALRKLAKHPTAVVREGATYGLAELDSPEARLIITSLADTDPNAAVRRVATAALSVAPGGEG